MFYFQSLFFILIPFPFFLSSAASVGQVWPHNSPWTGSPTSAEELQAESRMRGRRQNLQHTNTICRRCRKCRSYDVKDTTIFDRMLNAPLFYFVLFYCYYSIFGVQQSISFLAAERIFIGTWGFLQSPRGHQSAVTLKCKFFRCSICHSLLDYLVPGVGAFFLTTSWPHHRKGTLLIYYHEICEKLRILFRYIDSFKFGS